MAKGRKLITTSRAERFFGNYSHGQGQGAASDVSDLREEDVWSMVGGEVEHASYGNSIDINGTAGDIFVPGPHASESIGGSRGPRRLPKNGRRVGGLSLAFSDRDNGSTTSPRVVHQFRGQQNGAAAGAPNGHHMATSAPVNVPDWHKILRVDSSESMRHPDRDSSDDPDSEWVPPHEYLARSRNAAATSVFEGVGRTLKGRDLSRVRDAVWSQTGFDG